MIGATLAREERMTLSGSGADGSGPDIPGGPRHLVLAVGPTAGTRAHEAAGEHDRLRVLAHADEAGPVLDAELPGLRTGWRVLAVGTPREVAIVRAAVLARGGLDEEVGDLVLDEVRSGVRVHCGRCHAATDTPATTGDTLTCPGCGAALVVTDHHSPTHGAVLGAPVL
jgi:ribosomal protein S27AE